MTIRLPEIDISLLPASHREQNADQKILFVGQMTAVGTATSGTLYENIGVDNEQDALFGKNSMLATMIRAARYHNKVSRFDAIPLADNPLDPTDEHTQSFASGSGFTYESANTEFTGEIMQQIDQGGGTYVGDLITAPTIVAPTVISYASFTATDDGTIRYILDGQYWTGAAWALSDKTWAQSSTASDISAHILTLVPQGTNITFQIVTDNGSSQMWVSSATIVYYSGSGSAAVAATGTIAFTGPATESGEIEVSVGSKGGISTLNHVYTIPVSNLDSATTIGATLVAAINADTTSPVTAVNNTGSVALTAVQKGTEGNFISLSVSGTVAGVAYTLTGMANGSLDPVVTTLFDVVGDTRYQTLVYPSYVRSTARTFLDARFNVSKKILDGVGIDCMTDTSANIAIAANAYNSQSTVIIANKKIATPTAFYTGSGIFEINTIIASQVAAIRALRLTEDVNIAQYVSATYGAKDSFGGMHIASLPYFNTIIPTLPLEDTGKNFTDSELAALTAAGATTLGNNVANTNVILGTTLTTYKTDGAGDADVSFKYLEYVDTEVTCREYFYNNLRERFSQSRLSDGDVPLGYNAANSEIISAEITGLYVDLANLVLVQIGKDAATGIDWLAYFKQNLVVTLDLALGKATVTMILPIVTQLRTILMSIQVAFSANS